MSWRRIAGMRGNHLVRGCKVSLLPLAFGVMTACGAHRAVEGPWEPARLDRMFVAMKEAKGRGDAEACVRYLDEGLAYVDASAVRSLNEYAALLQQMQRSEAEAAQARADKLRDAKSLPGSTFLGFLPGAELRGYASLLEEVGRTTDAEAIRELATAYESAQYTHYLRLRWQHEGRNPNSPCY